MGEVAAVGDHLQQSAESQPRSRNPWLKMIYQGLRAMINLMPNSYQINQNVNCMELDKHEHDKDFLEFSASYFRMMHDEGNYVWRDLTACIDMMGATYSSELDRFIPDLAPKRNFTAADSVLTLFNDASPKVNRHRDWATEQWQENQHVWSRFISQSKWAIRDGGHILDIIEGLQHLIDNDAEVGGDPSMFQDHVNFLSMQNEKKGGLHDTFKKANTYLNQFPAGTLTIMGPGDADMWWPTSKDST